MYYGFFFYFRRNPTSSQTLEIDNADSIRNSNFNPSHPTVVVVHGWLSNQNTNINPTIRDGKIFFSFTFICDSCYFYLSVSAIY